MNIAFTCSYNDGKYFVRPRYIEYIQKSAEICGYDVSPVILPITDGNNIIKNYAGDFDGFVFTGGDDVEPSLYGEEKLDCCGDIEKERDLFELKLLREIIKLDKPVLGICRGIQIMNVFFGGTLWQDIAAQLNGKEPHTYKNENGEGRHVIKTSGFVRKLAGSEETVTNSYHHQAVKSLGKGLTAAAISSDGIIEAVENQNLNYYKAVQWHPEIAPDNLSFKLTNDFLTSINLTKT